MRLFVDEAGNTLTHEQTGLMWQLEDDGQKRTLAESDAYCRELSIAGHRQWRLPEIQEIREIRDVWAHVFINPKYDEPYWSSTLVRNPAPDAGESMKYAACVFFSQKEEDQLLPDSRLHCRAVRRAASYAEVDSFRPTDPGGDLETLRRGVDAATAAMRRAEPEYQWGDGKSLLGYASVLILRNQPLYAIALDEFGIGPGSRSKTIADLSAASGILPMTIQAHADTVKDHELLNIVFRGSQQMEAVAMAGALAFARVLKASGAACWTCRVFD